MSLTGKYVKNRRSYRKFILFLRKYHINKGQTNLYEVADVLIYLVQLCNALGVDAVAAAREKLAVNARRFPVRDTTQRGKPESSG